MSYASKVIPVTEEAQRIRQAYRVGEAAWLLGLRYDATLAAIHAGELGARRVGRHLIVPAREIERFLAPAVRAA